MEQKNFQFSGQGGEYFRIWIVNLCLSILTLGIYSAWAKVRRMQYFYRNTSVAGGSFDYHGDPKAILKGRVIAAAMFGLYSVAGNVSPAMGIAAFVLLLAVMPWLVVRSFKFRLHNSSYRGLRFSFRGTTKDGYINFLAWPLLSYVTLLLLWPLAYHRIRRFIANNSFFGTQGFEFHASAGAFYKPYLVVFGSFILIVAIAASSGVILAQASFFNPEKTAILIGGFVLLAYLGMVLFIAPYLISRLQNIVWNATSLGPVVMKSEARARDLFEIWLTNFLLIILTLGLYKPFADIRMARYRVESMSLLAAGDFETFIGEQQQSVRATGEEMADMFDLDIAL
jgi:uncharacterized membrane protein YjgN (DUF898 family)